MSFPRPEPFEQGSKLQKWLNWLSKGRVVGFIGGDISEEEEGVMLSAQPAITPVFPFQVDIFLDGSTWKATLNPGTIFSVQGALTLLTVPTDTISFTVASINYFYLACTVNDYSATEGDVSAAAFTHASSPPSLGSAATSTNLLLATSFDIGSGVSGPANNLVFTNQTYQRARNWFQSPAAYQHLFGPF